MFKRERESHLSNKCLKTNRCYYCKGIHNSAICNWWEEKETMETMPNSFCSSDKEIILLQTAEVYVINKRSNKEIELTILFDSGSKESYFYHKIFILAFNCWQYMI